MNRKQLTRLIRMAQFDVRYAEIHHGHNSPERQAAIAGLVKLQAELSKLNLDR